MLPQPSPILITHSCQAIRRLPAVEPRLGPRILGCGASLVLALGALVIPALATPATTFLDGSFNPAEWEQVVFTAGTGGSASVGQVGSGGNPDEYERVVTTVGTGTVDDSATVLVFRGRLAATYDPQTQGAIASIDYSEDSILFSGFGDGQATGPALKQNGKVYAAYGLITGTAATWRTQTFGHLGRCDFSQVVAVGGQAQRFFDHTQHPDFSANGSGIEFGFFRANNSIADSYSTDAGIDNWSVTVTTASTSYLDGTLNDADWSAAKIIDTTVGQGAIFTVGMVASGGNPDAYRRVTHTYDTGDIFVAHLRGGAVYNPATQAPNCTIAYSYDVIHFNPPPSQAVAYSLLLYQNGSYYWRPEDDVYDEVWTCFGHQSGASDFVLLSGAGPVHPDFSSGGGPIQFGYVSANESTSGLLFRDSGLDNWQVTIVPTFLITLNVDRNQISWNSAAPGALYDVVRGDLATLHGTRGDFKAALDAITPPSDVCMADNTSFLSIADIKEDPALGGGYFFLVRCDGCTYDSGAASQVGSRDPGINASAAACP